MYAATCTIRNVCRLGLMDLSEGLRMGAVGVMGMVSSSLLK